MERRPSLSHCSKKAHDDICKLIIIFSTCQTILEMIGLIDSDEKKSGVKSNLLCSCVRKYVVEDLEEGSDPRRRV